jgi:flagellar basal body-associated protein FliL
MKTENNVNIFGRIETGRKKKDKIRNILIATAVVAIVAICAVIFFLSQNKQEAPRSDVYSDDPSLVADNHNPEQVFDLYRLQIKLYFNTDRAEDAVRIGEWALQELQLTERQKMDLYFAMANAYIFYLDNPDELEKYVNLIMTSPVADEELDDEMRAYYPYKAKEARERVQFHDFRFFNQTVERLLKEKILAEIPLVVVETRQQEINELQKQIGAYGKTRNTYAIYKKSRWDKDSAKIP